MKRSRALWAALVVVCLLLANGGGSRAQVTGPGPTTGRTSIGGPAVPGQYLVKFKQGASAGTRQAAVAAVGGRFFTHLATLDVDGVEVPAQQTPGAASAAASEKFMMALKQNPNVEYVEPNYVYQASYTPNDPSLNQQYAWTNIQAYAAWDVTRGSASTVVAIVDTGAQLNHPELSGKIVAGYDYVDNDTTPTDGNGHGTHVSGTVAATTNNGTGGAGTCPNCSLMPVRVLDNSGSGTLANVANGITYAADHGAKVINMSLGGSGSSTLQNAVDYAWGRGVFMACAAGNDNTSSQANAYPGAYANCFAVASTTNTDARSSFSNYGSWVEAAAPGSSIYSTWLNSGYNTISGTSMATPHVAGLAGLLSGQGLTNAQIRSRICSTSDAISGTGTYWTCGRINAYRAVSNGGPTPVPTPPPGPTATPAPGGTEKIVNGGFESGTSPWVQSSTNGYQLIDTTRPHAGSYSAYLGGYNSGTDTIYQTVTVPSNGVLTYWWYMTTSESGGTPYDYLRVRLYNSSGTLLTTLRTWSNASGAGVWRQDSLSLAAYAGQTVRVHFAGTTDSSLVSSFFVDDVSVR
ncbi:MAG TPA: S8 family serine peptidase [Chloroflexia bacterium]|nr:S8 family serine peptidase [Chloroflexia bacterium]